ncbi:uncharacterized protein V6R79_010140 [Siganus canaliculatus]
MTGGSRESMKYGESDARKDQREDPGGEGGIKRSRFMRAENKSGRCQDQKRKRRRARNDAEEKEKEKEKEEGCRRKQGISPLRSTCRLARAVDGGVTSGGGVSTTHRLVRGESSCSQITAPWKRAHAKTLRDDVQTAFRRRSDDVQTTRTPDWTSRTRTNLTLEP